MDTPIFEEIDGETDDWKISDAQDLEEMIGTMIEGGKGTMEGTIEEQTSIARDIKGEEERVHNMHAITFLLVNLRSNRMSLKYIIDPISRTCKFSTQ